MNGEAGSYLALLDEFFKGLKNSYKEEEGNYERKLSHFFEPLVLKYRVAREIKKQTDKFLASDFNLVGIMNPDEGKISDIIAEFLKPDGKHGQGGIFLEKFLEMLEGQLYKGNLDKKIPSNSDVIVEREVTANGFIDIQITFKGERRNFILGIENKPWAGDQPSQLKRYSDYLKKEHKNYVLLFISGNGRLPSEFSIPEEERKELERKGNLLCTSYHRFLIPWLRECFKECEAEKVRWFLRDFISWIEKNFREEVSDGAPEERNH
jgi:hypothetical protein